MGSLEMQDFPWYKIYRERGIPITLQPYPEEPSHSFLDCAAKLDTDGGCVQLGLTLHYRDIKDHADRLANALTSSRVFKGDRVVTMLPTSIQFVIADAGISKTGAVHIPCNPLEPLDSLAKKVIETSPKMLICLVGEVEKARYLLQEASLHQVIVTRLEDYSSTPPPVVEIPGVELLMKVIDQAQPVPPSITYEPKADLESLFFTGGTTGIAKCCMISHYNVVANVHQTFRSIGVDSGGTTIAIPILMALPLYHVYGHVMMHAMISLGAKIILANNPRASDELRYLVREYNPWVFLGVPTQYTKLLEEKIDGFAPIGISGSAPLPPKVQDRFEESTGAHITEGYGLSEMTMSSHVNVGVEKKKRGSIGIPFPDTVVKIIDVNTGEPLDLQRMISENLTGEMLLKGPQRMVGYWPEPETGVDEEGFIHTGDVVRIDEDGFFYIVDRTKDMINVSGLKVYSREIENVLYDHPATAIAAAVGVPDPDKEGSERVVAFVQLKPGYRAKTSEADYLDFLRDKVIKYAVPKSVVFLEEIPLTYMNKVDKKQLREKLGGASLILD
jgi:long-chain acyl-CoA synthetase